MFETVDEAWGESFTPVSHFRATASMASVRDYTDDGYEHVNRRLRGYNLIPFSNRTHADIDEQIEDISRALKPVDKPIRVFRNTQLNAFDFGDLLEEFDTSLVGREFTDKGFISTSIDGKFGHEGNPVRMTIDCPVGTRCAYLEPITANENEREILLECGTKFRIVAIENESFTEFYDCKDSYYSGDVHCWLKGDACQGIRDHSVTKKIIRLHVEVVSDAA